MQVSKINTSVRSDREQTKGNRNRTSFKGLGPADSIALGVANAIENGGLAVSFTLQDMIGTNLPRPIMGLRRNAKENKGEKNLKFALKEAVREFMTGPSMFLIPLTMLGIGKKVLGSSVDTPSHMIKSFGDIHAANILDEAGNAISKTDFYKNTFAQIIKNAKSEAQISGETLETAADFAKRFANAADKNALEKVKNELNEEFVRISKSHAADVVNADFTAAKVAQNAVAPFKNVLAFMKSYADDVVEKAAKGAQKPTEEIVKKLINKKAITRFGMNIAMYAAVLSFLQIIPKLYNKAEGKNNAGLKGLMTEETFKNTTPLENEKTDSPDKFDKTEKTDKSNPSFGSAAGFVNTITGPGAAGGFVRNWLEYSGPNVSFPLLVGIMALGIVMPRMKNAKDKYDREEIIRRDVVTCAVMCFAEKALRKCFSKANEKASGFVVATKPQNFKEQNIAKRIFDYIRPVRGVQIMNSQQIAAKYGNIHEYKEGIKGFCDFISGQGGNLSKIFSFTPESKQIVSDILQNEGKELATADNKAITEALAKAADTDAVKELVKLFENKPGKAATQNLSGIRRFFNLFKVDKTAGNPWIRQARTMNARFTALSVLVIVPVFLGFMLPWINEKTTKKRVKEELEAQKTASPFENSQYFLKNKPSDAFSEFKTVNGKLK